jgi:hypothetical protein
MHIQKMHKISNTHRALECWIAQNYWQNKTIENTATFMKWQFYQHTFKNTYTMSHTQVWFWSLRNYGCLKTAAYVTRKHHCHIYYIIESIYYPFISNSNRLSWLMQFYILVENNYENIGLSIFRFLNINLWIFDLCCYSWMTLPVSVLLCVALCCWSDDICQLCKHK